MKQEVLPLGATPRVSTLCLPEAAHDQISQAFPLRICILQEFKYWRWEQPGNEAGLASAASVSPHCKVHVMSCMGVMV